MTGKYPGTVKERGRTPYYDKPILLTDGAWDWHQGFMWELDRAGIDTRKTWIVQGGCMALVTGGGADDSSGYHDWNGAIDYHLVDYVWAEQEEWAYIARCNAGIAWPRGAAQGMDVHGHIALPWDETPIDSGIYVQRNEYVDGGDGLVGGLPDYVRRPNPLVLTPPKEAFMPTVDEIRKLIQTEVPDAVLKAVNDVIGGDPITVAAMLRQTHYRAGQARDFAKTAADPQAIADAVVAQLGPVSGITPADLETALRSAFASLANDTQE